MNSIVQKIAVSGSDVYAGGWFTTAGGEPANYIAKWDGTNWSALGSGMNNYVYALAIAGSEIYASGYFTTAGEVPANYIAKWDGANWSALGSGLNHYAWIIAASGTEVYAGGYFTTAGGKPSSYFGRYVSNALPVANAGTDQTVITAPGTAQITLDGSGSNDPDNDPLTYTWSENGVIAGPSNSATSQVTLNVGIHTIALTVDDGKGGTATDVVVITVQSAEDAISDLITTVTSLNIKDTDKGIKNAWLTKLGQIQAYLQNDETKKAVSELNTFINQVTAQRGKALTEAEADALIAQAQAIIAAINAASAPKLAFSTTGIGIVPNSYELEQNYPNPFNPVTTIQFSVPRESYVRLKVYNSFGAEVATLVDQQVAAGTYKVNWDASRLASGFYLYRLEAEGFAQTKKLLLMK
jgi:hypothetical protein